MDGLEKLRLWFNARPHKWQMLIGFGSIAAVLTVVIAGAIVWTVGLSASWRAGRDWEKRYIADEQNRFGGSLSADQMQSFRDLRDSVYLLADSYAGGQAFAGGKPAYNRDEDPPRFDRAIARWHARFVLDAAGITADEAALALSAAKGLAGLKTRDVAARTLRDLATTYGLRAVVDSLR